MIYKKLDILMKEFILADFYRDFIDSESLTGFVSSFNDKFLCLNIINDTGLSDGISIIYISDITRIAWGGNERESLKKLFVRKKNNVKKIDIENISTIEEMIGHIYKTFGCINLLTENIKSGMAFIGRIIEIDKDFVYVEGFGTFSTLDISNVVIKHSEITRIDAGGRYENDVMWLSNTTGVS